MRPLVLSAVAVALLAAGCGPAATSTPPPPSAAAAPSPAAATPTTARASADVVACRAMEAYPKFTGTAGARRYVVFLGRQMTRAGTNSRLDDAIQTERAAMEAVLIGAGTTAELARDARRLQAVCTSYGVRG